LSVAKTLNEKGTTVSNNYQNKRARTSAELRVAMPARRVALTPANSTTTSAPCPCDLCSTASAMPSGPTPR